MEKNTSLRLEVIAGDRLPAQARREVVDLCNRAFEEDLESLLATFTQANHVLGWLGTKLVTHALWVPRWLQAGTAPPMHTAYVEAVATDPAYHHRGYASAVMRRVAEEIADYDLGGLAPSGAAFYARLGWECWRGPLFIRSGDGLLPTPDEGDVMILRLPKTPTLNLDASLSAEWREGELW